MNIIISLFNYFLGQLFFFVGDWGLAIITLTVIVKVIMLPITFKQKDNMNRQQELSKLMEDAKVKYKKDKEKLDQELLKLTTESTKNMLGCLTTLIHLPVMLSLYRVFMLMPFEVGTMVAPWIINLKLPDSYYILPLVSALIQLLPGFFNYFGVLKGVSFPKLSKQQIIMALALNLIFLARAPVSIAIYWITTGFFSMMEQIAYSVYKNKKSKLVS